MKKGEKIIKIIFIIILYIVIIFLCTLLVKELNKNKTNDNKINVSNNNTNINDDTNNSLDTNDEDNSIDSNNEENDYILETDIENINDDIVKGSKNDLKYYKYYDETSNEYIIAIFEKDEITDKTYNSLITFVKLIKGESEVESFKENVPILETTMFDNYEIILNPILSDNVKNYYAELEIDDTYKLTQLKIKNDNNNDNNLLNEIKIYEGTNKSADTIREMILKNKNNISSYIGMPYDNYIELTLLPSSVFTPDELSQEEYVNEIINTYIDNSLNYNVSLNNKNNVVTVTIRGIKENNIELVE